MSDTLTTPFETENEAGVDGLIPEGRYPAEIVDAKVGSLKSGRGEAVDLTWVIEGGEYDGRHLWQKIILQHDSDAAQAFGRKKFKSLLDAVLITETLTSVKPLIGKRAMLTVGVRKDENGQYDDQNEIKRVKPLVSSCNGSKPALSTKADLLKDASPAKPGFKAENPDMSDEIPF